MMLLLLLKLLKHGRRQIGKVTGRSVVMLLRHGHRLMHHLGRWLLLEEKLFGLFGRERVDYVLTPLIEGKVVVVASTATWWHVLRRTRASVRRGLLLLVLIQTGQELSRLIHRRR